MECNSTSFVDTGHIAELGDLMAFNVPSLVGIQLPRKSEPREHSVIHGSNTRCDFLVLQ